MFVILLKYLLSFDTAKVRRFLKPAMDLPLFFSKKWVSFDVYQVDCVRTHYICVR